MKGNINKINLKAPGNWINDPNGFIYYKGKYHLFYQYFPYGTFWGTMHWGHAVSDDLVTWEHLDLALFPSKEYDRNGVFSGSAIEIDEKMYLYYTAAVYEKENPENIHVPASYKGRQSQALVISEDGFTFDNFEHKLQVIPAIMDTEVADPSDCRDPKVWKMGDTYYMCLASTHLNETGVLLIFKSEDAIHWQLLSRLESDKLGFMLECPDLFAVNGKWMLISCPMGVPGDVTEYPHHTTLHSVTFHPQSGEICIEEDMQFLDYGFDVYATQSNLDEEGRRVFISWVRMKTPMKPDSNLAANGKPWNGMMTIPRVVEVRNNVVHTVPHPNIRKYFLSDNCRGTIDGSLIIRADESHRQILTTINEGEWIELNGYRIGLVDGTVVGDRSALVPEGVDIHTQSRTPYVGDTCMLEIYQDHDLVEIFIDDGRYVLSHVTYTGAIGGAIGDGEKRSF